MEAIELRHENITWKYTDEISCLKMAGMFAGRRVTNYRTGTKMPVFLCHFFRNFRFLIMHASGAWLHAPLWLLLALSASAGAGVLAVGLMVVWCGRAAWRAGTMVVG
jgi:hypothetical protein